MRAPIDGLGGELRVEQKAVLPLDVKGKTVNISDVVDYLCVTEDLVESAAFKTDRSRRAAEEYRKLLSENYHVLYA